jgi:phosphoadenosine phosphosulfate reductase
VSRKQPGPAGSRTDAGRLRALVDRHAAQCEAAPAEAVLRWAHRTFGARLCATSSMADAVVVHLVSCSAPGTDVLFLDTGLHFKETLEFRRLVRESYAVNVVDLRWDEGVAGGDPGLVDEYTRDPQSCCRRRKVTPLRTALASYDAWVTGIRRSETANRATTPVLSWDESAGVVRIAPLASWSDERVAAYARDHDLPRNRLADLGYTSIGCAPCTSLPTSDDPRSGRWPGLAKTECGLHVGGS